MCLKTLNQLLRSPVDAIKRAKRQRDRGRTLWVLILTWILIGASFLIVSMRMFPLMTSIGIGITFFLLGLACSAFCSYITVIVMNVLGGRGQYFDGLTVISYSSFPISSGIFITSLLTLIHPMVAIVGFVIIAVEAALSLSVYFRSVKILFRTDMMTIFIGFLLTMYVFIISFYLTLVFSSNIADQLLIQMVSWTII
jgi:hypothetical protein